jgi:hypothetical protein
MALLVMESHTFENLVPPELSLALPTRISMFLKRANCSGLSILDVKTPPEIILASPKSILQKHFRISKNYSEKQQN